MYFEKVQERFLQALSNLDKESRTKMERAYKLAEKEHSGQVRKAHRQRPFEVDPYLIHPLRVSLILMEELKIADATSLCSAVLHDVVEDGNSRPGIDDIRTGFGDEIAVTVQFLTKPEPEHGKKHDEASLLPYHQSFVRAPLHVRLVKLSDRLDNLRESLLIDRPTFQSRYLSETRQVYIPLAAQTSLFFFDEYQKLCRELESLLQNA